MMSCILNEQDCIVILLVRDGVLPGVPFLEMLLADTKPSEIHSLAFVHTADFPLWLLFLDFFKSWP